MKDPSFDFRHEVFLKEYSRPEEGTCPSESADKVRIKTLQDDPDLTRFSVSAPCEGFFVLADLYYPGWIATIDGRPVRIYNANYAFRAVRLSAGSHVLIFRYAPWTVKIGLPVAGITLIISGLLMLFVTNKKRISRFETCVQLPEVASQF